VNASPLKRVDVAAEITATERIYRRMGLSDLVGSQFHAADEFAFTMCDLNGFLKEHKAGRQMRQAMDRSTTKQEAL